MEETLNSLLDAEADALCKAKLEKRYERTAASADTRAGSYTRSLQTKAAQLRHVAGTKWGSRR